MLLRPIVLFFIAYCLNLQNSFAKSIKLDNKVVPSLMIALAQAKQGSVIELSSGEYHDGGVLTANGVTIRGENGTHLVGFSVKGKGTLVIQGNDTEITGIECSQVTVKDKNGACVRLEGENLTLDNVYFHDSEQGLLTGKNSGLIVIENSRFERLGSAGQAHGIYVGSGRLYMNNSHFLSAKDQGHEIKSRASKTIIHHSVIASLDSVDSRLIDVPNGGVLEIKHSILQQREHTSNWNLIGYGLEGISHKENSILITNNTFLLERSSGNWLLDVSGEVSSLQVSDNIIAGKLTDHIYGAENQYFRSSKDFVGLLKNDIPTQVRTKKAR